MIEGRLLEEFSRMNNELIDARRELQRVNAELSRRDRFLTQILELSPQLIYVYDLERDREEYANRNIAQALGYGIDEIESMGDDRLRSLMHPDDLAAYASHQEGLLASKDGEMLELEFRIRGGDGSWRWIWLHDRVFERDGAGRPKSTVGVAEEITERKLREELLAKSSLFDELTGLHNRRGFEELARQHILVAARRLSPFALVYVDLDRFKSINDRFGHAEGDEALRTASRILKKGLRAGDILARLGGDEFVALVADADESEIASLVPRLEREAREWNGASGKAWQLRFSAGYSVFDPGSPETLELLLDRADKAMYESKRGRDGS